MDILPSTLRDLNGLRRLEHACFNHDAWPLLDLIAVLTWPGVVRLKAMSDGQLIGFIAGDPHPLDDLGWIATLGVLPEYRRQGIAKNLLEACEAKMTQNRIRLCVRPVNEAAIRLYQQAGYFTIDTWKKYYNDGESALVMEKIRGG